MTIFDKFIDNETYDAFRNIKYLDPECIPNKFNYRDSEMNVLGSNLVPLFYNSQPIHTVIIGGNATGKTTAIKKVFEELEENIPSVVTTVINCRKDHTEYKIYSAIKEKVTGKITNKGSNSDALFDSIMSELAKNHQSLVVALDDVNYLLGENSEHAVSPAGQNVIRRLVRASEDYGVTCAIYPIITSMDFLYKFDMEVHSVFQYEELHFHAYTADQLYWIIKERCDYVFYEGTISDDVIHELVKIVQEDNNNLRKAWLILKKLCIRMKEEERIADLEMLEQVI